MAQASPNGNFESGPVLEGNRPSSRDANNSLSVGLLCSRSIGRLFVKRLSIFNAALDELRPIRYHRNGVGRLRQQAPKFWMMPAQFMPRTVAMPSNALSQLLYFFNKLIARHSFQVCVHDLPLRSIKAVRTERLQPESETSGTRCAGRPTQSRDSGDSSFLN